jgi:hypothetical protein
MQTALRNLEEEIQGFTDGNIRRFGLQIQRTGKKRSGNFGCGHEFSGGLMTA